MRHWIFDLDGTLVDSFSLYFEHVTELFADHGLEFTPEIRTQSLAQLPQHFLPLHLGAEKGAKAMAELLRRSQTNAMLIRPFAGIPAVFRHLAERNSRIAVWTSRDLDSAQLILRHNGLSEFVELCVSGGCVTQHKPHPEGLGRIQREFACAADELTMVGDHDVDMIAAKAAGARAVRAAWHGHWNFDSCAHADHQFHAVPDFAAWLGVKSAAHAAR